MSKKDQTISIVTPSFKQADFLARTIENIWGQEGDFYLEHIIADGGSPDHSVEVIKKYEKMLKDGKIKIGCKGIDFKWWSEKDKGQTDAIIKGTKVSSGILINWINSDDILIGKDALQKIWQAYKKSKADVIIGRGALIDENDKKLGEFALLSKVRSNEAFQKVLPKILKGDFMCQQSVFYTRKLYNKIPLDINDHYCMDWNLYAKFYRSGAKFFYIDEVIGALREQPNAKTQIMPKAVYQERLDIYRRNHTYALGRVHSWMKVKMYDNKVLNNMVDGLTKSLANMFSFYKNRKIEN